MAAAVSALTEKSVVQPQPTRAHIMKQGSVVEKILSLPIDESLSIYFRQKAGKSLTEKLSRVPSTSPNTIQQKLDALNAKAMLAVAQKQPWLFTQYHNPLDDQLSPENPLFLVNRALDAMQTGKTVEQKLIALDDKLKTDSIKGGTRQAKRNQLLLRLYHKTHGPGSINHSLTNMIIERAIPRLIHAICHEAGLPVAARMKRRLTEKEDSFWTHNRVFENGRITEIEEDLIAQKALLKDYKAACENPKHPFNICCRLFPLGQAKL